MLYEQPPYSKRHCKEGFSPMRQSHFCYKILMCLHYVRKVIAEVRLPRDASIARNDIFTNLVLIPIIDHRIQEA